MSKALSLWTASFLELLVSRPLLFFSSSSFFLPPLPLPLPFLLLFLLSFSSFLIFLFLLLFTHFLLVLFLLLFLLVPFVPFLLLLFPLFFLPSCAQNLASSPHPSPFPRPVPSLSVPHVRTVHSLIPFFRHSTLVPLSRAGNVPLYLLITPVASCKG